MNYYSTASPSLRVSPREAVMNGLAPDGGLYMPESIPKFEPEELRDFRGAGYSPIALQVLAPYFSDITPGKLAEIVFSAFDFPVPLKEIEPGISVLELFHGPTLAFKDFGARFLARLMSHYRGGESRPLRVLVATSGDTGSAVANGFFGVEGVEVFVLYPRGKVSRIQEQQLTTLGGNITALEVGGNFDDCQRLVKEAFLDPDLRRERDLSSANSISIGRLLPQMVYYVYAWSSLGNAGPPLISVPSGNLGNLAAGVFAKAAGLPVAGFVSALNRNDVFGRYLSSGAFEPRASKETLSNAMDVGNPSNIARLIALASGDMNAMRLDIEAHSFSDEETVREIGEVFRKTGYLLDPHGAVGLLGLRRALAKKKNTPGIFLATAHPAKFVETVEKATGEKVELPPTLEECLEKKKVATPIGPTFAELKQLLLN